MAKTKADESADLGIMPDSDPEEVDEIREQLHQEWEGKLPEYPALPPLPEAPASVNFRVQTAKGYVFQWTLRDSDEHALLSRLGNFIQDLERMKMAPYPNAKGTFTPPPSNGGNQLTDVTAPLCPTHNQPMKESQYGGYYCTVKIADDDGAGKPVYCKQKVKPS